MELNGEPAVAVAPGDADAVPVALVVLAFPHLVGDEARPAVLDSGIEGCFCVSDMGWFPFLWLPAPPLGPYGTQKEPALGGSSSPVKRNYGGHPPGWNRHSA